MSRYCEIELHFHRANPDRVDAVKQAAAEEWPFEDWYALGYPDTPTSFGSSARDNLCSGEGEHEFARRLARAIWEANGDYCEVEIRATYLENLPCETYSFDEDEYGELVRQGESERKSTLPT